MTERMRTRQYSDVLTAVLLAMLLAPGCGTASIRPKPDAEPRVIAARAPTPALSAAAVPVPVPEDLAREATRSQDLGRELASLQLRASSLMESARDQNVPLNDVDAWMLSSVVTPSGQQTGGWVLLLAGGTAPRLFYDVRPQSIPGPAAVRQYEPPDLLAGSLKAVFVAQRTALAAVHQPPALCDRIVMTEDAIGGAGLLVYVLTESMNGKDVVLGPHYRVLVEPDGMRALEVTQLSSPAILQRLDGESASDAGAPGLHVEDFLSDVPSETYVLQSLRHGRVPVYVTTSRGRWRANGETLEYLGE